MVFKDIPTIQKNIVCKISYKNYSVLFKNNVESIKAMKNGHEFDKRSYQKYNSISTNNI